MTTGRAAVVAAIMGMLVVFLGERGVVMGAILISAADILGMPLLPVIPVLLKWVVMQM